ncbi:MAG: hypothetical protein MUE65_04380 [Methanomassiliicoccales archaeon]|nr:hypothetical protein [Methanomassiliicoccales archaeon]
MAFFECTRCGRVKEMRGDGPHGRSRYIECVCGGRMLRQFEDLPNEMRDIDNELGMDR